MGFPDALKAALDGAKIIRSSYGGHRGHHITFDPDSCTIRQYLFSDSSTSLTWYPTQEDMQAMDWELVW